MAKILERLSDSRSYLIGGGGRNSTGSSINFKDDETPTGIINGVNTTFTLSQTPLAGSLKVYRGGARQKVTEDYTLSATTITFILAPQVGEIILCDYRY